MEYVRYMKEPSVGNKRDTLPTKHKKVVLRLPTHRL